MENTESAYDAVSKDMKLPESVEEMKGHCNKYSNHKRWCGKTGCSASDKSKGKDPAGDTIAGCVKKCDSEEDCVAIAFKANDHCVTYYGTCEDSADSVKWGFTYYRYKAAPYYSYPACLPGCLVNNGGCPGGTPCHQVSGRMYKVGSTCYLAQGGCWGCLANPAKHTTAFKALATCKYIAPTPEPTPDPTFVPLVAAEKAKFDGGLAKYDKDGDLKVTWEEAEAGGLTKEEFDSMDANGDGVLTAEDYTEAVGSKSTGDAWGKFLEGGAYRSAQVSATSVLVFVLFSLRM